MTDFEPKCPAHDSVAGAPPSGVIGSPVPIPVGAVSYREAVAYADSLAHKNSEALSFLPLPRLKEYARLGQLMVETENDEPCGFLVHGVGFPAMRIYQHCIQYDARRRDHGLALVGRLIRKAVAERYEAISLKCAADLEANAFWREAGFNFVRTIPGGKRRGRTLNVWYMELPALTLFRTPSAALPMATEAQEAG